MCSQSDDPSQHDRDGGPWRGISRRDWVDRFVEEARVPTCPRCGHPWPFHKPDEERGGYACRACRCRRTHPPKQENRGYR